MNYPYIPHEFASSPEALFSRRKTLFRRPAGHGFRAFPPFLLNCKENKSVVTIVHAAGAGGLLNCFQITRKLFFIDSSGPKPAIRSSMEFELAQHGAMELVDLINDAVRSYPKSFGNLAIGALRLG